MIYDREYKILIVYNNIILMIKIIVKIFEIVFVNFLTKINVFRILNRIEIISTETEHFSTLSFIGSHIGNFLICVRNMMSFREELIIVICNYCKSLK
jgi:hypothetical protein